MLSRATFLVIVAFWLTMNLLLWRSQMEGKNQIGNVVQAETVWQKILTAPDNSSLEIYQHEKKIGFCHWVANLGQSMLAAGKAQSEDYHPEGMIEQLTSYNLNFEGNATLAPDGIRLRFEANLKLSADQAWQDFHLRASVPQNTWDVRASAREEKIRLKIEDANGPWEKIIKFSDLEDPEALMQDFGGPYALGILALLGGKDHRVDLSHMLHWEAHEDRMRFGHSKVRVYRLQTKVLGQTIYVFVSRVGEILWVELPEHITLRNEAFSHF